MFSESSFMLVYIFRVSLVSISQSYQILERPILLILAHTIKRPTYTFPDIPDNSAMVQIARLLEPGSSHTHSASALVSRQKI